VRFTPKADGIILLPLDVGLHVSRRHQPHRMPKRLQFARPLMRGRAGLHTNEARRHFLEERQDLATLQLTAEDHLAIGVNAVHLKTRFGDVETDCLNCLHVWLLSIVGALKAPTFMALACRWRSRPQHQKRTFLALGSAKRRRLPRMNLWSSAHGARPQCRSHLRMPKAAVKRDNISTIIFL